MSVPDTAEVSRLLDQLGHRIADDLESEFLDFKPWQGPKDDLKLACEYAACFANAGGGVVVFGVADKVRGRAQAIHGAPRANMTCATYPREISEQRGRYVEQPTTQGPDARSEGFLRSGRIARGP